jgi:hypothetical protein
MPPKFNFQSIYYMIITKVWKTNSIYFEQEESTNIFSSGLEIKEYINIKELLTYNESCIVIYSHIHLNDQLIELMNNNIITITHHEY